MSNAKISLEDILEEYGAATKEDVLKNALPEEDPDEKARFIFDKVASEVKLGGDGVLDLFPRKSDAEKDAAEIDKSSFDEPDDTSKEAGSLPLEKAGAAHSGENSGSPDAFVDDEAGELEDDKPVFRVGIRRIDYTKATDKPPAQPEEESGQAKKAEAKAPEPEEPKRSAIWAWEGAKVTEQYEEEDYSNEPSLTSALKHYSKSVKSLRPRLTIAFILCLLPAYITLAAGLGFWLPEILTLDIIRWVLLAFNAVMLLLCYDIVAKGVYDLFRMRCGFETAAVAASMITMIHASLGNTEVPYCTVSTIALFVALHGNYHKKSAIRRTLRTAINSKEPYGVVRVEDGYNGDAFFKTKTAGDIEGFITMTESPDCAEKAFSYYVPILVVASIVFSVVTWLSKSLDPLYVLAACISAGLPLGGMLCYAKPFDSLSRRLSHIGSALAGWKGALAMSGPASIILTDGDIFPKKTITFNGQNGLKIYGDFTPDRLISYTASILIHAGSGLAKRFEEIADLEHLPLISEFQYYESGGLGATIQSDVVLVGSYSFMMLMGVRIPQETKVKNAAYISINGLPAGVFSMDYKPADLIQDSLKALIREKNLEIVLAARDFTITPTMVKRSFKVSSDPLELPTIEQRVELSDPDVTRHGARGALICREGLPAYADAVIGGRALKKISLINTVISIIGGVLGVCIMFLLMYTASYASASAAHVLIYTLAFMLPVIIFSSWANRF